ncbi:hypothetical protein ACWCXB_32325 [Streptomyces sp. NPDC001514]
MPLFVADDFVDSPACGYDRAAVRDGKDRHDRGCGRGRAGVAGLATAIGLRRQSAQLSFDCSSP